MGAIQLFRGHATTIHSALDIADSRELHPDDQDQIKKAYAAACFAVGRVEKAGSCARAGDFPNDHLIPISQGHTMPRQSETAIELSLRVLRSRLITAMPTGASQIQVLSLRR